MPARNSKGRFVKSGSRSGGRARRASPSRPNVAVVAIPAQRAPARKSGGSRPKKKKGQTRRRRNGGGTSINKLLPYAVAGLALGYIAGEGNVPQVQTTIDKIPGAKTLGRPLTIGLACLAANKFVKRNRYLAIAGTVGCIVGAYQLGVKKLDVKWVGDPDDGGPMDDGY